MAVRSVLQIDVDDTHFKNFYKQYKLYQSLLKNDRHAWQAVNDKIKGTGSEFNKLVAKYAAQNIQAKLALNAQKEADRITRTTAERWSDMARNTREVSRNIAGATVQLLKWGSITGVISGLIGAGGLFGLDRLALGAASSRRGALGIGASIGGQESFKVNFGRLGDMDSFLSSVADAKFDINKRTGLIGAGLSNQQINGDTANTAVAVLDRLKKIADTTDPMLYASKLDAFRMSQFATPQFLERLHGTSPAEYEQMKAGYRSGRSKFDVEDSVAKKWQDLATQLDNAGKSIETTLIKGLANLAPGITKLSESFAKVAGVLLEKGGPIEQWVTKLDGALEKFAGYVGTEEFQKNVRDFVNGIAKIASSIGGVVSFFGKPDQATGAHMSDRIFASRQRNAAKMIDALKTGGDSSTWGHVKSLFAPGEITEDQLLTLIAKKEGGTTGRANPYGAIGKYQIKPGTAVEHGINASTLWTEEGNEAAARKILADYAKRYHGNLTEILAAYNQGTGAGDKFRNTNDDIRTLKPEGQRYVTGTSGMRVVIENNTGGNAIISTNALKN